MGVNTSGDRCYVQPALLGHRKERFNSMMRGTALWTQCTNSPKARVSTLCSQTFHGDLSLHTYRP